MHINLLFILRILAGSFTQITWLDLFLYISRSWHLSPARNKVELSTCELFALSIVC